MPPQYGIHNSIFFVFKDFEGQSKAEFVSRTIVVLFGVVGFVFGWYIEQFSQTVYILGAGLVFAAIVSVLYKNDYSFFKLVN